MENGIGVIMNLKMLLRLGVRTKIQTSLEVVLHCIDLVNGLTKCIDLQVLPHESHNKFIKHSWKNFTLIMGFKPRPRGWKSNALTTKPKSWLSDEVVRDWICMYKLREADN